MSISGLVLFLFGLAVGSFLNVVAIRYKEGGKLFTPDILKGRSHCPYCQKTLAWYELIPLFSFLIQFGKCRHCKHSLSWQYPIVELLSGLTFLLVPRFAEPAPIAILVVLTLILIALIDMRLSIIPDQLNIFLAILGLAIIVFFPTFQNISDKIIGAIAALAVLGLIVLLTRGRGMGIGDVKLAGALGLLFGWQKIILLIAIAFMLGGIFAAGLLLYNKKSLKDAVPFGPFLSAASIFVIFIGDAILRVITK